MFKALSGFYFGVWLALAIADVGTTSQPITYDWTLVPIMMLHIALPFTLGWLCCYWERW